MPGKMLKRELAALREQAEERQARDSGAKAWLLREIALIRERRTARLDDTEREAHDAALAARRAALVARSPEELARLAEAAAEAQERAAATGDPDDTRAAMLARLRLIQARPARGADQP